MNIHILSKKLFEISSHFAHCLKTLVVPRGEHDKSATGFSLGYMRLDTA